MEAVTTEAVRNFTATIQAEPAAGAAVLAIYRGESPDSTDARRAQELGFCDYNLHTGWSLYWTVEDIIEAAGL